MSVIMWAGHIQKSLVCLLKYSLLHRWPYCVSTANCSNADLQHDFHMLPGSSQQPFSWVGEHEALCPRLQERGGGALTGPMGKAQKAWQYQVGKLGRMSWLRNAVELEENWEMFE